MCFLSALFFPSEKAGNYLFGIYILGAILGLFAAKFLRMTAFRELYEPFVMEMPNIVCQIGI